MINITVLWLSLLHVCASVLQFMRLGNGCFGYTSVWGFINNGLLGKGDIVRTITMMTHSMTYSILEFLIVSISLGLKVALLILPLQGFTSASCINKQSLLNVLISYLVFLTRTTTLRITDNSSNNTSTPDTDKKTTKGDSMGLPVQTTCTQTCTNAHAHTHKHANMYVSHHNTVSTIHDLTYGYHQCQH